jgi:acyl CoA:acetate/3-ketoacid CoA transferase alpha subunit
MEEAIKGDFSLIKAWRGDKFGNLQYRLTARNFNEDIAGSSKVNIAEVEEIVDEIPPNQVHTQGIKIDRMF